MASSLESILLQLLVPDNLVLLQATNQLREIFKNPDIIEALVSTISSSENTQVRQYAAILLRRKITRQRQWIKYEPSIKQGLKNSLLQILVKEPEKIVKNSIAQVIGLVAKHELAHGQWPELLQFLNDSASSDVNEQKEIGLFTLSIVSSVAALQLKPYILGLLSLFNKTLQDHNHNIQFFTIQILTNLVPTVGTDEMNKFQCLVPLVMNVICSTLISDEEQMSEALDIFEELMECQVAIMYPHVKPLVEMCLKITANCALEDNTRVKAMSVICTVVRLKKKSIVKHKLIGPVIDVLFPIMCAPSYEDLDSDLSEDGEENEIDDQSPVSFAPQVIDLMALHLPAEKLMVQVMRHLEPSLLSCNPYPRKAGYLTIAVLAEGCSEHIRNKYLQSFLQVICKGLKDSHPVVQNSALFALGQFAEYLQPDVCNYHAEIMPLLFEYLTHTCQVLQQGGKSPPHLSRTFYAMETFCESLGERFVPYIETFMKCALMFLSSTQSISARELAISSIGAAGNAIKEAMLPYFSQIIEYLKPYLSEQQSETTLPLQIQSIDTLGVIARTIGQSNFQSMAHDSMRMGINLIDNVHDPDLRRSVYGLFASVSSVLKNEMEPYMASIMAHMLDSLISTEGLVPQYDEQNGAFMLFDDLDDEVSPEEEDIGDDSPEESDDEVVGFNVENSYLDEKEDTCWALKEISANIGPLFLPYYERCFEETKRLVEHLSSDVRKSALVTLGHFCINLHKTGCLTNSPQTMQAFAQSIGAFLPKLICTCQEDMERPVVLAGLETMNDLLKEAQSDMLDANSLEAVVRLIQDAFSHKLSCQDETEAEEDDQEAEYDGLLLEYAGEIIPTLAKALPQQQFMPYLQALVSNLVAKASPRNSVSDKSFSIGTLAEVVEAVGAAGILPLLPSLQPLFLRGMNDTDEEVRSNSVYGLGLLIQCAGEAVVSQYPMFLQSLSAMLVKESNPRAKDNICGAVARLIMNKPEAVPMKEVFPVFLQCLPLKEDFVENSTVYKCIHQLYHLRHEEVFINLSHILKTFSSVIMASTSDDETKKYLIEVTKASCQEFPKEFESTLNLLPPENQNALRSIIAL